MDSNKDRIYQQNPPQSSGFLRFRSAPGEVGSRSDRLMSRFTTSYATAGAATLAAPSFHELEDKSRVTTSDTNLAYANSSQHTYSWLPPNYQFLSVKSQSSNLARQKSSPPGLFANLSVNSGSGILPPPGLLNYGGVNDSNNNINPSTSLLKRHLSISSSRPSPLGIISEVETEATAQALPTSHWSGMPFSGLKRELKGDGKQYAISQEGEAGNRLQLLSHHLSLPKELPETGTMEKLLQFQEAVPCKIRAKRGCATHPRSIAERLRRTRISERMRKLQELVPNMDKQTNTADMLDLAVVYIKDLQRQFKDLSENRANCKCMNKEEDLQNRIS